MRKYAGLYSWLKKKLHREHPAQPSMEPQPFAMRATESSNIAAIGYQPASRQLRVQFKSGGLYQYSGVPQRTHKAFDGAPSKGKYFARNIRGEYPVEHLNKVELSSVMSAGRQHFSGFRAGHKFRQHMMKMTGKKDIHSFSQADLRKLHDYYTRNQG